MNTQPEALRLADLLEDWAKDYATTDFDCDMGDQAAAELRRLHEANQELLEALRLLRDAEWGDASDILSRRAKADAAIAKHGGQP